MSNIHGHCPHCNADLDGELIIDCFIKQGIEPEEAERIAASYAGWNQHGADNKFGRVLGIYCMEQDRVTEWKCPDCGKTWSRF